MWAAKLTPRVQAFRGNYALLRWGLSKRSDSVFSKTLCCRGKVSDASIASAPPFVTSVQRARKRPSWPALCWKLSKERLPIVVAISALPGYFLVLPGAVDPVILSSLAIGTYLTAASAQSINQMIEVDQDRKMNRTSRRPLCTGQMTMTEARIFAVTTGSLGLAILGGGTTPACAGLSASIIALYNLVYTPMKVVSPYNTHVGAIIGSLPTVLGFTAVLGSSIVASPWALHAAWFFALQTVWQMPHFYAIAWMYRADYRRGGYQMFPMSDPTGHLTAAWSKKYLIMLNVLPLGAAACGLTSWVFPMCAAVPSTMWWRQLAAFEKKPTTTTCKRFFLGSLTYLLMMIVLFMYYGRAEALRSTIEDGVAELLADALDDEREAYRIEPEWRVHLRRLAFCPDFILLHS